MAPVFRVHQIKSSFDSGEDLILKQASLLLKIGYFYCDVRVTWGLAQGSANSGLRPKVGSRNLAQRVAKKFKLNAIIP